MQLSNFGPQLSQQQLKALEALAQGATITGRRQTRGRPSIHPLQLVQRPGRLPRRPPPLPNPNRPGNRGRPPIHGHPRTRPPPDRLAAGKPRCGLASGVEAKANRHRNLLRHGYCWTSPRAASWWHRSHASLKCAEPRSLSDYRKRIRARFRLANERLQASVSTEHLLWRITKK